MGETKRRQERNAGAGMCLDGKGDDAPLTVASLDQKSVRSEKGVPVDSLVVVAQPSTARRAAARSAP